MKEYIVTYTFTVEAKDERDAWKLAGEELRDPSTYDSDRIQVEEDDE